MEDAAAQSMAALPSTPGAVGTYQVELKLRAGRCTTQAKSSFAVVP